MRTATSLVNARYAKMNWSRIFPWRSFSSFVIASTSSTSCAIKISVKSRRLLQDTVVEIQCLDRFEMTIEKDATKLPANVYDICSVVGQPNETWVEEIAVTDAARHVSTWHKSRKSPLPEKILR